MHFNQATNGNFRYEEFVKFIELDKFVSGSSITKNVPFFLEQTWVQTCKTQIKLVLK